MEPVLLPECKDHNPDNFTWSVKGKQGGDFRRVTSTMYYIADFPNYIKNKYDTIAANEARHESFQTEDAEVVMVAYGISSRLCQEAVALARAQGIKLGLIRPITLWPFPQRAFQGLSSNLKGFLTVELSSLGQICEDVAIASKMRVPVYASLTGDRVPEPLELVAKAQDIIAGKATAHMQ